ncbi:MAG: hypothetical protein IPM46_03725 [Flavobacteriales bacterium]|nr:hypothetical protein [Flavobacteriales bacterium]
MKTMRWTIGLVLFIICALQPMRGLGQQAAVPHDEEHRYLFHLHNEVGAQNEKLFSEALLGFDPAMRVLFDRPYAQLKLLAYRPVDPQSVISLAGQLGISLSPKRTHADPQPNLEGQ